MNMVDPKDHSELKVYCFYNELNPVTSKSVIAEDSSAEFIDTSGSDFTYWHELSARWNTGYDIMTVEQDIELQQPQPLLTVLDSFKKCPGQWCVYSYWVESAAYTGWLTTGLGCTRFRRALMDHVPALKISDPYRHWKQIDMRISRALALRGYYPHVHGRVNHLREY